MIETPDIERPPQDLIESLGAISSATASGELARLGIRDPHLSGCIARTPGQRVVGPALTLQFMPKREDLYDVDEYADPERQHGHGRFHRRAAKLGVELVPLLWNSAIPSGTIEQPYKHKHNC